MLLTELLSGLVNDGKVIIEDEKGERIILNPDAAIIIRQGSDYYGLNAVIVEDDETVVLEIAPVE